MRHELILIGDAVVPAADMTHPVMTVYDIEDDLAMAHCNWLTGHRMHRATHPVERLVHIRAEARAASPLPRRGPQR